ncbi:hypothetical protein V5O48_017557, partial [Marasmius crinis-equi]
MRVNATPSCNQGDLYDFFVIGANVDHPEFVDERELFETALNDRWRRAQTRKACLMRYSSTGGQGLNYCGIQNTINLAWKDLIQKFAPVSFQILTLYPDEQLSVATMLNKTTKVISASWQR